LTFLLLGLCFSMCFCFKAGCKSNAPVSSLCCWGVVLRPVGLACSAFVVLFVWLLSCCACGAPVADPSRFANIPFAVPFLMVPFVWFYSSFRFVDPFVWFRSFSSVHLVPVVFGSISIAFVVPFMVPLGGSGRDSVRCQYCSTRGPGRGITVCLYD
jgi:hypothetical protein